jgi:hypothetical protein
MDEKRQPGKRYFGDRPVMDKAKGPRIAPRPMHFSEI